VRFFYTLGNFYNFFIVNFSSWLLGRISSSNQKILELFVESHKRCTSLYFYFSHLKKENQNPLSPLNFGEQKIFHIEGNLNKLTTSLDSRHDLNLKTSYLVCRCPLPVHLEFSSPVDQQLGFYYFAKRNRKLKHVSRNQFRFLM